MRPDQRWFPTNMTERAAWFQNFTVQFANTGPGLGFTQAEIDSVLADNAVIQFLARAVADAKSYTKAVETFQRVVLLGKHGSATPAFPVLTPRSIPGITPTGVFERLERTVRRIRVAPGYTVAAGALLGIIPVKMSRIAAESYVPGFKLASAAEPYTFEVSVTKRSFPAFSVWYRRANSDVWEDGQTWVSSPARITVKPTTDGLPEQLYVRVRMLKGNEQVGNYSQVQIVIVGT